MSKKLVIVALMAVLAIGASVAQATPSRLDTLGQNTGLVYIQDDTNIFFNPADLADYRNCLLFHMGGYGGSPADLYAMGGVSLGLGEMLTLGIIVARNPAYENSLSHITGEALDPAPAGYSVPLIFENHWDSSANWNYSDAGTNAATIMGLPDGAMTWHNPIDLILAAKLGNINLGVSWYYANGKHTSEYTDTFPSDYDEEMKARLHVWKFGVATTMGNITPEVWFHYAPLTITSTWNYNIAPTSEIERELKARRFNVGARVAVKVNDNLSIVPMFEYVNIKGDATIDTSPDFFPTAFGTITEGALEESYTGSSIQAGVGINYSMERLLVASSIGLQYMKFAGELSIDGLTGSVQGEEKWMAVPVVGLGLEYQCTKILVFRGGIATTVLYAKSTDTDQADVLGSLNYEYESTITEQSTRAAVGIGLNFGNLVIDLTAGEMILAGEPAFNSLFSAMDFKYKF